jgi:activator of the mannose operon (transcriptional antiterminator)
MHLNSREKEIVKELLATSKFITVDTIAKKLNVSDKTIRNHIININNVLQKKNLGEIVKKPRIGVYLKFDSNNIKKLEELLINNKQSLISDVSIKNRKVFIIRKLLFANQRYITMQDMADGLYTSRSSVINLLKEIEEWFKQFGITIARRQHSGIEICYSEMNWRRAVDGFYRMLCADIGDINEAADKKSQLKNRVNSSDLFVMKQILEGLDVEKIEKILSSLETAEQIVFAYDSYLRLLLHVSLGTMRKRKNKSVEMPIEQVNEISALREYKLAEALAKAIGREFQVSFAENDILYFAAYLLMTETSYIANEKKQEEMAEDIDVIRPFINELIHLIGTILNVDLRSDEEFVNSLTLYLRPALYRLKFNIHTENPFLQQIKENYPRVFGAAWASSILFEKYFNVKVGEDEIAFLSIYVETALERINHKMRTVVVCNHGVGISQLLSQQIRRAIPGLEVDDALSLYDYKSMNTSNYDFALSTIPLSEEEKPVIYINSILKPEDIHKIKEQILQYKKMKIRDTALQDSELSQVLYYEDLIFANLDVENKKEAIEYLSGKLLEKEKIHKEFIQSVLEREDATSTVVGQGIAIPHGSQQYVLESTIAVAKLKKPIKWKHDEQVDIVFLLAFDLRKDETNKKMIKNFYAKFALLLDDVVIKNKIRESQTARQIYDILKNCV